MKTEKICCCFLCCLVFFSFFGCTENTAEKQQIIGGADTKTSIIVGQAQSAQSPAATEDTADDASAFDKKTYTPKISEDTAREIGKSALEADYAGGDSGYAVAAFTYKSTALHAPQESAMAFNGGRDGQAENKSGHPYWVVTFFYTESLCDHAYYCIDAETGDVLYGGFYGD